MPHVPVKRAGIPAALTDEEWEVLRDVSSRPHDPFGIGYYYRDVESRTLRGPLQTRSLLRDEWGFEAFYNVAITPWMLRPTPR